MSVKRLSRLVKIVSAICVMCMAQNAHASLVKVVLFTGFSSSSGNAGMNTLNNTLSGAFGAPPYMGRVFGHTEQQEAFNWITSMEDDIWTLVIIGHSLGGDSVIELAEDFLLPAGKNVDLTIQIDSVGVGDEVLPSNVDTGINYFQESTGLLEPQGAMSVQGATDINVETLFGDPTITHTSIDDDVRLHNRIVQDIAANLNVEVPEPSTLVMLVLGGVIITARRGRSRMCRSID